MRAVLATVLLAITLIIHARVVTLSDAQAKYDNNVNEMARLVSNLGENPEKLPPGWKEVYVYNEKYGDKGYDKNKVFVNTKTKQVVMAYGGTQMEAKDWEKNIQVGRVPLKINGVDYGKVHSGFKKQFDRTEKKMFENAQKFMKQGYKLEIAGHSQGGAAATIASVYAKEKYGVKNVKVVTFGSPATGNPKFAKVYNSRIKDNTRVVNSVEMLPGAPSYDPISHSTSIIPVLRYTHIGKEKKVTNGKGDIISYKGTHDMVNYERATRNRPVLDKKGPIAQGIENFGNDVKKNIGKGVKDIGRNLGNFGRDVGRNFGNFGRDTMKNIGNLFGGNKKNSRRSVGGRFGRSKKNSRRGAGRFGKSNKKNSRRGVGGRFGKSKSSKKAGKKNSRRGVGGRFGKSNKKNSRRGAGGRFGRSKTSKNNSRRGAGGRFRKSKSSKKAAKKNSRRGGRFGKSSKKNSTKAKRGKTPKQNRQKRTKSNSSNKSRKPKAGTKPRAKKSNRKSGPRRNSNRSGPKRATPRSRPAVRKSSPARRTTPRSRPPRAAPARRAPVRAAPRRPVPAPRSVPHRSTPSRNTRPRA